MRRITRKGGRIRGAGADLRYMRQPIVTPRNGGEAPCEFARKFGRRKSRRWGWWWFPRRRWWWWWQSQALIQNNEDSESSIPKGFAYSSKRGPGRFFD